MTNGLRLAIARRLVGLQEAFSFDQDVRHLVEVLNRHAESPEKLRFRLPSHPLGFVREVTKRRLTIAEAYLKITVPGVEHYEARLEALRLLVHLAEHAKTLSMPRNTARVQVALMKACVNARDDRRRQHELMSDFALASWGRETVIRRLLRKLDLIELPEDERSLKDLDLAWDGHVHDTLTEGSKTPSQVVLDAFIRGISRLTVAYYDIVDARIAAEAVRAGRILGIDVQIGIEFSAGPSSRRQHFMYLPPRAEAVGELESNLEAQRQLLAPFFEGLARNAEARRQTVSELMASINRTHIAEFNAGYPQQEFLQAPPLSWDDLERIIHGGQASRLHLGQHLLDVLLPVQHKRVLYLRNQHRQARDALGRGVGTSWEVEHLAGRYQEALQEFHTMSATGLAERLVYGTKGVDYASAFTRPEDVLPMLSEAGGRVVFIHPLSQGPQLALTTLLRCHRWIHEVETFNMASAQRRDPADLRRLSVAVGLLNANRPRELGHLLEEWGVVGVTPQEVREASAWYGAAPLRPRCGSDATGREKDSPGMGFVRSDRLDRASLRTLRRAAHPALPAPITQVLLQRAGEPSAGPGQIDILVLGSGERGHINHLGDEQEERPVGPVRWWRYLNVNLKFLLKVAIGFLPAVAVVGPGYASLWLGITALRNIVVDLVSASGLRLRAWRLHDVDRDNLANSLLWTGFSVPVLSGAKHGFDVAWPWLGLPATGFARTLTKFWVLAFANGLYISSHNKVRGFDRQVIRGNFFRTVLSWPLATAGSYLLDLLGIPAIVQAKIWSDVVAGIIEGSSKALKRIRLSQRDLGELLASLPHASQQERRIAMADILFIWARRQQGKRALTRLLRSPARSKDASVPAALRAAQIEGHRILCESFAAPASLEDLTGLLLQHYSGGEAALLCGILAEHHQQFVEWLRRTPPPPKDPESGDCAPDSDPKPSSSAA